jgi:hypothetical protein
VLASPLTPHPHPLPEGGERECAVLADRSPSPRARGEGRGEGLLASLRKPARALLQSASIPRCPRSAKRSTRSFRDTVCGHRHSTFDLHDARRLTPLQAVFRGMRNRQRKDRSDVVGGTCTRRFPCCAGIATEAVQRRSACVEVRALAMSRCPSPQPSPRTAGEREFATAAGATPLAARLIRRLFLVRPQ